MQAWLDRLRQEIEEATAGLDEAELQRAPEGHWSSAHILDHLGRTYGGTAKLLEQSLATNQSSSPGLRPPTLKERTFQFLVVTLGKFPEGQKSPDFASPQPDPGREVLPRTLSGLERMREALAAAEKRWGNEPVAIHFVLGPMSAPRWRKFHYVHGHHHLRQIRQRSSDRAA